MADMSFACDTLALKAEERSSTGLNPNLAGLLTYFLGWLSGIFFLIVERQNKFVRFHAIQSILVFGPITAVMIALDFIPVVGWFLNVAIGFGAFVLWIVLMARASVGATCTIPLATSIARREVKS